MDEQTFLQTTRTAYDTFATEYDDDYRNKVPDKPLDRAMLATFAGFVGDACQVADLGCGTGRVTAHLHTLGVDAFGIDLSPRMLALAREDNPHLRFEAGSMTELTLPDASLAGIVASYSIIHVPDELLPELFAGFARVLAPDGYVLVVFFTGDEQLHRTEAFGHEIALDYYLRPADRVATAMRDAGLVERARVLREPDEEELLPRAFLLARKQH